MDEQPMETTPQGEDTPPSEHTPPGDSTPQGENPPGENSPQAVNGTPGENSPLPQNSPPASDNSPPLGDNTPGSPEAPPISEGLRADLCRVWALGFLDCMKGEQVNDDDVILSDMAESLVELAENSIDHSASLIAQVFVENPQTVFQTVYSAGFEACLSMNLLAAAQLNRN